MKFSHKSALMVAATLALLAAGCKQNSPSGEVAQKDDRSVMQQGANEIKQDANKVGAVVADSAITAKIKAAIVAEPDLSALDIKVDTSNGIVTLTGTIDTPQKKERAAQLAQTVDGVKTVNNQLSAKGDS